jgi:adenosylhomocysteine nucleosidase
LLITGLGRHNARAALGRALANDCPEAVFTCGFAGGLNPALVVGEVVYESSDGRLRAKLERAGAKPAKFYCASRITVTAAEKAALRRTTGADAVEMESEAIHALCRERAIPCATVRAISDAANEDLPLDFNELAGPDCRLAKGRLAWAIAKSPRKITALLRLQRNCQRAARNLATVLEQVLPPR